MSDNVIKMPSIIRFNDKGTDRLSTAIDLCLGIEARQEDRRKTLGHLPPLYAAALVDVRRARKLLQRAQRKLTGAQ